MTESLIEKIEKSITNEKYGDIDNITYNEFKLIKEKIQEKIEELRNVGGFEDEIEESEMALEDEEITYDELIIVLENLEEL
ncbi:signal recognition particle protein [Leptotrichia trevisanii]|jgi:hypothetical protein|uniref:Signal recognition particle protein n=1 Tax=Leptotrichia trevisanii TaxID=109328 RepID=A0A510JXK8_9FUSO|nr:hypothetical protein [Leptotrichia trevisanii]BBM44120.1 signal recognition particle protein [Leptotrichia trevisanii]BBM51266.1 signal recognition particle protein [Leptotrichia trevisanii]